MIVDIEELKKVTVSENELLFIRLPQGATDEAAMAIAQSLEVAGSSLVGRTIICSYDIPFDFKKMSKEDAKLLLDELRRVVG